MTDPVRDRLWQRVQSKDGSPAKGLKRQGETLWLELGVVGHVRHLMGEQLLRHATLREIREHSETCC